ncbi:hypothetical protein T484DRAFT_1844496 [Baffinella frigidus]|nr:hypothetical protein T484DRAFT_1844496 [Cryptophyta sp. CCMP2293]
MPYRDWGQYATYASHNMVPKPLWDEFVKASCVLSPSANASSVTPLLPLC